MKAEIFRQGLHVFKQNLKFSSAHFLIFDSKHAEKLHGHNYQVILNVYRPLGQADGGTASRMKADSLGYWVDFGELKKRLKELVDLWDEKVLLPRLHPEMRCEEWDATTYKVSFRNRVYAFPKNEVEWLPVVNTSVECLSELLLKELVEFFEPLAPCEVELRVEETPGQGASTWMRVGKQNWLRRRGSNPRPSG